VVSTSPWETTLAIVGLGLTLVGALVLAWRDLTAKRLTWDTLNSEPSKRRRLAWIGFPLIAIGSVIQIVGVAVGAG
jgi:hypothetical protein